MKEHKKKCPHCGEWSRWNLNDQDQCEHCGNYLFKNAKKLEKSRKLRANLDYEFIPIGQNDKTYIRVLKKVINLVHLVFMAVVSAIMWFITTVAS